jgi:uncharacterized DUF497 family protein
MMAWSVQGMAFVDDNPCSFGFRTYDSTLNPSREMSASIEPEAAVVLQAVRTYRKDRHGEEIIHIISSRRTEKHEIRRYQEQAME